MISAFLSPELKDETCIDFGQSLQFVRADTANNTPSPGRTMKGCRRLQRKSVGRLALSSIISIFSVKYAVKSFDGSKKEAEEPDRRCNLPGTTLTWSAGLPHKTSIAMLFAPEGFRI